MYFLDGGWGRISNGFTYGVSVNKRVKQNRFAELIYSREDATGSYNAKDYSTGVPVSGEDIPLHVSYFLGGYGWLIGIGASGTLEGYAGLNLGAAFFRVEDDFEDKWMFSTGVKLGLMKQLGEKTGIMFQASYLAPVQRSGNSIYMGTGGTTAESATLSTVNQFSFSAGLIFRIK
jgi:hypothetical protein